MASKLFHAVVGFGISLGAMSVGCSASSGEESARTEAAQTESAGGAQVDAGTTDRFCEVAWPTTKGGPRPQQAMECIDPQRECRPYPGTLFDYEECRFETADGRCDFERGAVWMFCKAGADGHDWACPSHTIVQSQCSQPGPSQ